MTSHQRGKYAEANDEEGFFNIQLQLKWLIPYRNGLLITYNAYNHLLLKHNIERDVAPIDTKYGCNIIQLNVHFDSLISRLFSGYNYIISELIEAFGNISGKHDGDYLYMPYFDTPNHKLFSKYHKCIKPQTFNALRVFDDCMKRIFNCDEAQIASDSYFYGRERCVNRDASAIVWAINNLFKAIHHEYGINVKGLMNA